MGNAYNNASLLVTPNGYKASKIYSAKPTDGTGDLTFSRASNATRVNSAGLIEKARTNVALQSETFDTASWLKSDATITANVGVAPNGTTTADKIVPTTTGTNRWVEQSRAITTSIPYTNSFFVKADGFSWVAIHHIGGSVGAWFNVSSGTIGTITAGNTALITSVGNGWYRCSVARISGGATGYSVVQLADADNSLTATASGTNGLLIWGAQTETGDIATDYIPTTTAAVSVGITADIPRLDYTGGGCPSLLLEPQRTNLLPMSEQITNATFWNALGGNLVATANVAVSPDGNTNADSIALSNTANRYYVSEPINIIAGTVVTYSVYMKSTSGTLTIGMGLINGATAVNKTVTTDWQRFSVTFTMHAGGAEYFGIEQRGAGASTSGTLLFWGAQVEVGSYATSYIPTLGSSVTRLADVINTSGKSALIGQTEGVIFADVVTISSDSDYVTILQLFGNSSNRLAIGLNIGTTNIFGYLNAGGGVQFFNVSTQSVGRHKIAFAYKSGEIALYIDGVSAFTSTSTFTFAVTLDTIFMNNLSGSSEFGSFKVKESILYKTRLSNAELAELTTL
jgi:hypothetical protein